MRAIGSRPSCTSVFRPSKKAGYWSGTITMSMPASIDAAICAG